MQHAFFSLNINLFYFILFFNSELYISSRPLEAVLYPQRYCYSLPDWIGEKLNFTESYNACGVYHDDLDDDIVKARIER